MKVFQQEACVSSMESAEEDKAIMALLIARQKTFYVQHTDRFQVLSKKTP